MQVVLGGGAVVAFGAGYATQRLSLAMLLFAATFLAAVVVSRAFRAVRASADIYPTQMTVPAWPRYNRHHVCAHKRVTTVKTQITSTVQ
jgi:hypothetical protein